MRRLLLSLLPKSLLSAVTGLLTRVPLPRPLRPRAYGWFAARYGACLADIDAPLDSFGSFAAFFSRPLREGARPIADAALVWPCDGKIVTAGPVNDDGLIPQVKEVDYSAAALVADAELGARFAAGSQATVYLAPGDYHRVHAPFSGRVTAIRAVRGTLYPVNPPTVAAIPNLFVRNARKIFAIELDDGRCGAVVMVGALNVGSIEPSCTVGDRLARGDEIGRFGFGSTVVVLIEPGGASFDALPPGTAVRVRAAAQTR